MQEDYTQKRRHRRVPVSLTARISTIDPERDPWTGRPFFRATRETCLNLSRGGVFIGTSEPLAPGRRILVELALPDGRPLEAIGRVAWSRRLVTPDDPQGRGGVGVEFLGAAADRIRALDDLVDAAPADDPGGPSRAPSTP